MILFPLLAQASLPSLICKLYIKWSEPMVGCMAVKLDPDLIHPDFQPYIQTNATPLHSDQEA